LVTLKKYDTNDNQHTDSKERDEELKSR